MVTTSPRRRVPGYALDDGSPAQGWVPASRARRLGAALLESGLIVGTLGVGWVVWATRLADRSTTPAKSMLGLTVFATDTRAPADRNRMLMRTFVYGVLSGLLSLATVGLAWLYSLAGLLGPNRRTISDEWARVVVLAPPRPAAIGP